MGDKKSTRDKIAAGEVLTSLFIMEFAPGGTNFPHHHETEEEIYLVLDGSGDMVAGGGMDGVEGRHPARAAEYCRRVLAIEPNHVDALQLSGLIHMEHGDFTAAAHLSSLDYLGDVPWHEDEAEWGFNEWIKAQTGQPSAAYRTAADKLVQEALLASTSRIFAPGATA